MKHLITLLALGMTFTSLATAPPSKKSTSRYEVFQQQTVTLPTPFAKPFIIDQSDIALLSGKTIHHVDLVYTKYRSSPSFNQEALNNKRVAELKKLLPQINADHPSWSWIEQTGATDRETANTYFHGFVIHYSDKQEPNDLREFLSDKVKPMTAFTVTPEQGGTFNYASGTRITLPPNAVTYEDGTPVKGAFELQYREFRDPAEIALSGLPMTYSHKGINYNFSSVGMYEIRGKQGDKELKLKKPVTVDFNCTKVVDDAAFYRMDDATGEWKKIETIDFEATETTVKETPKIRELKVSYPQETRSTFAEINSSNSGTVSSSSTQLPLNLNSMNGQFMQYKMLEKEMEVKMNNGAWDKLKTLLKDSATLKKAITSLDEEQRTLTIQPNELNRLSVAVFNQPAYWFFASNSQAPILNTIALSTNAYDTYNNYATVAQGLRSASFGVYNCDQIYRIGNPHVLSPVYTDAATENRIEDLYIACLIDLTVNGSFSFHPNNITYNPNGRNVLLLFTNDKKTYLIDEETFAKADKNNLKVNLLMKDVTDLLKTPEDLKQLLKI